jgi:iron-sulfur cluster assembly protein
VDQRASQNPIEARSVAEATERMTFSSAAAGKATELLGGHASEAAAIRVFVKSGGCSGYSYGMAIDDVVREGDRIFVDRGVRMMVDERSWELLRGSEIDYVENMMGGGFSVVNPNATSACGCGHSFRTDGRAAASGEGSDSCH